MLAATWLFFIKHFQLQPSAPDPSEIDGHSGGDGGFGTLPASGPLPPHLAIKQEQGRVVNAPILLKLRQVELLPRNPRPHRLEPCLLSLSVTHSHCSYLLWILRACACLSHLTVLSPLTGQNDGPAPGTGHGYSGYNSGNAEWDRGANLKEYYQKKEQQDAEAVGTLLCHTLIYIYTIQCWIYNNVVRLGCSGLMFPNKFMLQEALGTNGLMICSHDVMGSLHSSCSAYRTSQE